MSPSRGVSRLARRLAVLGAAGTLVLASCRDATAVRVHVYTDVAWEGGRRVVIAAASEAPPSPGEPLAEIAGPWSSPDLGDFVLLPSGDKRAPVRVAVVMGITKDARACSIERPDGCIFSRRKLGFLEYRTLTVPVNVYSACIGIPCTPDTTCNVLGQCVPADVDPEACASPDGCPLPGESPPTSLRPEDDAGADGGGDTDANGGGGDAATDAVDAGLLLGGIAVGGRFTCRWFGTGGTKCWGQSSSGELGLGDTSARGDQAAEMGASLPFVDLGTGRSARVLASGAVHTCALLDNDRIKCWGASSGGTLGLGDSSSRGDQPGEMGDALPYVDLGTGRSARTLTTGRSVSCALLDNDQLKCWGFSTAGQLGLGDSLNRGEQPGDMGDALPYVSLGTGRTARAVAAGGYHTCALLDIGQIKCWGYNFGGALGLGDTQNRGGQPGDMGDALPYVSLGAARSARALAAGNSHVCAILDNDQIKCWGENSGGQLGLGDTQNRGDQPGEMGDALPYVSLGTGRTARAVTAGDNHTCALLDDGRIKCWGSGGNGELGLGDTNHRGVAPGQMGDALPFVSLGAGRAPHAIAANGSQTCALLDNGQVKCWGWNANGELGLGDTNHRGDGPGEMGDALPFVELGP